MEHNDKQALIEDRPDLDISMVSPLGDLAGTIYPGAIATVSWYAVTLLVDLGCHIGAEYITFSRDNDMDLEEFEKAIANGPVKVVVRNIVWIEYAVPGESGLCDSFLASAIDLVTADVS